MRIVRSNSLTCYLAKGLVVCLLAILCAPIFVANVQAGTITGRIITLSTSVASAAGVDYTLASSDLPTAGTPVKSVTVQFCTAPTGVCVAPAGISALVSTLASQPTGLGAVAGWTVNTAVANELRIGNAGNASNPAGAVNIPWSAVTNPSTTNTTFFGVITTYSAADFATGPLDTGTVALSTATQIQVSLSVLEILTFCTGTSITGTNCATVAGSSVNLGDGSTTAASSGTSVMAASTNAATGYTITITGTTLTSGANTIAALAAQTGSNPGSSQFGINLKANTTPGVGTNVSGGGTGTATANYNTVDQFRFVSGDSVASVAVPTNANTFTISYIANIAGVTPPGNYITNMTYVATANF